MKKKYEIEDRVSKLRKMSRDREISQGVRTQMRREIRVLEWVLEK